MPRKRRGCPVCGGKSIPIVYGLPGPELVERAMRGEVAIGGCVIVPGNPTRECVRCGRTW